GKGELASGEEGCLLTVHCHQVGLGENFENGLLLKIFDRRSQIDVRPEQENIQQIAELKRGGRAGGPCSDYTLDASTAHGRARELLRAQGSDRVCCSETEKVEAELLQFRAVNLSEFYFQQNLALARWRNLYGAHDLRRIDRGHLVEVLGSLAVGHTAGQKQAATVGLHLHLL